MMNNLLRPKSKRLSREFLQGLKYLKKSLQLRSELELRLKDEGLTVQDNSRALMDD